MKRRLLSLFMAMVMVCSLVPVALAENKYTVQITGDSSATVGTTITLTESVTENGSSGSVTDELTYKWSAPDNSGVTVAGNGNTAKVSASSAVTSVQITCSVESGTETKKTGAGTKTVSFTAPTPAVTGVTLDPTTMQFTVGDTTEKEITATVNGTGLEESDRGVTWTSTGNVEVTGTGNTVKVKLKTGATAGSATVTATSTKESQKSATCNVTISAPAYTVTGLADQTIKDQSTITLVPKLMQGTSEVTGIAPTFSSSNPAVATVDAATGVVTPKANGTTTITVTYTQNSTKLAEGTCKVTVDNLLKITSNSTSMKLTSMSDSITLSAAVTNNAGATITWDVRGDTGYFNAAKSISTCTVTPYQTSATQRTLTVTASSTIGTVTYTDSVTVTLQISAEISLTATVSSDYYFSDVSDKGTYSVAEQLEREINRLAGTRKDWYLDYVQFSKVTSDYGDLDVSTRDQLDDDDFGSICFTPEKKGEAEFPFTAYLYTSSSSRSTPYSGILTIAVTDAVDSSGDITYTASLGEDVPFLVSDFEDFYANKYSRGSLEYVTFGSSSSNGTLYNEDGKSAGSTPYYVSPSSRQKALDSIYFSPKSSMKKSTTVKISFTAYGTTRNNTGEGEVSGTVSIVYLNDSAKDITYNTTGGKVTLDPKDFEEAYKEATGSKTAPSNLTIEFQDVPSNGTLTYTGGTRDKDLTRSNVKSTRYTTKSSGSNRLAQLTYSGTKGKDTISYIAYSGSTAQFTGKVVFNGAAAVPTDVVVTYGSTGGQAVAFSQNDFVRANSVMSNAVKVRFTVPANGTLQMSGANAAGIDIAASLLGSVSYKPRAGFNGTDKIIFAAYDASNAVVASGSVNVTVVGNPSTGTNGGTNPGGVTDVSQFKDVSSTAWYRNDLATLVSQGIITGKGDGKFDPLGTVTYGEALKMILEACGYTATLGTGSNWAINYKNLAVSNGWISSSIDLNAAISRNATAELAARVMGVAPATGGSPFADEANAYAVALYYTNPQIFVGDNTTGKLLFKNGSPLLRQEVCAVICRVRNYHTQHTTNTMPDGI